MDIQQPISSSSFRPSSSSSSFFLIVRLDVSGLSATDWKNIPSSHLRTKESEKKPPSLWNRARARRANSINEKRICIFPKIIESPMDYQFYDAKLWNYDERPPMGISLSDRYRVILWMPPTRRLCIEGKKEESREEEGERRDLTRWRVSQSLETDKLFFINRN